MVIKGKSSIPDIHYVNGQYYNYNGRNPDKALTEAYAKRLIKAKEKYGEIDTKTASGHGNLSKKAKELNELKDRKIKDSQVINNVVEIHNYDYNEFLEKVRKNEIDTRNLKTRFRAGFRIYDIDDDGQQLPSYTVVSYAKSFEGIVGIDRFLKQLDNEVYANNSVGGFRYVIYDKKTKQVHHNFEYGDIE